MKPAEGNRLYFPTLSKVLASLHAALTFFIFLLVQANAGGYQNGLQWGIVAIIDLPVFFRLTHFSEGDSPLNPALMS